MLNWNHQLMQKNILPLSGLNRRLRVPRLDKEDILLEGGTEGDKAVSARLRKEFERLPPVPVSDSDSASDHDDGGN